MQVTYKNRKLEKVCTVARVTIKTYGDVLAVKIHLRIDQLKAADNVDELVARHIGRCHVLTEDREGQYAMDLAQPYRLVFSVRGDSVNIARVEEITDYH